MYFIFLLPLKREQNAKIYKKNSCILFHAFYFMHFILIKNPYCYQYTSRISQCAYGIHHDKFFLKKYVKIGKKFIYAIDLLNNSHFFIILK